MDVGIVAGMSPADECLFSWARRSSFPSKILAILCLLDIAIGHSRVVCLEDLGGGQTNAYRMISHVMMLHALHHTR